MIEPKCLFVTSVPSQKYRPLMLMISLDFFVFFISTHHHHSVPLLSSFNFIFFFFFLPSSLFLLQSLIWPSCLRDNVVPLVYYLIAPFLVAPFFVTSIKILFFNIIFIFFAAFVIIVSFLWLFLSLLRWWDVVLLLFHRKGLIPLVPNI